MRRNRRFLTMLFLSLASVLGLATGWSQLPYSINMQAATGTATHSPNPVIEDVISEVRSEEIRDIVEGLSGVKPIKIGGQEVTLKTRYTPSYEGTLSEEYVSEYFQSLGLATSFQPWSGSNRCARITGRNVIAEIPGVVDPKRIYIVGGHLDSISPRLGDAPGADDNASGTAAVMIAARLLKDHEFDYTLRFVSFTGEERGLCGSIAYSTEARLRGEDIRGVINLDMLGYDGDGVNDIELHAGTRVDSQEIAELFSENIATYQLDLVPHMRTTGATDLSDHSPFWGQNYPAIAAIEYLFSGDGNPYIHSVVCCDVVEHMDFEMAADLTKAAIATFATLGGIQPSAQATPTMLPTPIPVENIPGTDSRNFAETGQSVTGIFLDYWDKNGGLQQQGYPISGLAGEISDLNGKPYTVQYFERAVFEYHPENSEPYNVLLSQLGTFQYKQKYPGGAPAQTPNTSPGSALFSETGKRVGGRFLAYWQENGGVAQQGLPISDEFEEKSDLDGKTYRVQYFERAVFELHPENQPPYDVLLSQLGTTRLKQRQGSR
ncbi:MAG TPA: M28 family peptidase [Chloroflexia bacterium]|nr:M28 family peptidase [Chloroflexia bacterium]